MMELILIVLFGALQIGDLLTTEKILNQGGKELNPVMNSLFHRFGMHKILVSKVLLMITFGIILAEILPVALLLLVFVYIGVVGWNLNQIRKSK